MSEKLCYRHNKKHIYVESDCPYCEIDRLKGELEEAKDGAFKREARIMMYVNKNSDIKRQLDASQALLAEARAEVRQVEQSAINFHEAWQQALNDLESVRAENTELRGINQSLSVNCVKYKDMKGALEFFARLKQDMLIVDINRIANAALHDTIEDLYETTAD